MEVKIEMIKNKKKIVYIILLIVYLVNAFSGIVSATQINDAQIIDMGDCGYHLQFWDTKQNAWSYIITTLVGYNYQGQTHYAYCLNADRHGVGEESSYNVNISTLLDDVRVWRTITAGFPYRSAAQLGCSTNEDAFVATKQAVYCILYGYNPETRYKGGDARGVQIKNAIISLVNEGREGTRTPQSANVSVNRVGDLVRSGDWCYQEMSVSSFVNMGSYNVTATNGLPDGSKIVNMNNQDQTAFGGGEHFKVAIPTNKVVNNMDVTVAVRARCETYPAFFGSAPSSNLQNYALTFDPMADEQGIAQFTIDTHKSTIKVIKEDAELKYRIPNVVFDFKYADGEVIGRYTTDSNGEITIEKLRPGTVIAKELETDQNYILNDKEQEIYLSYADSQVKSIENERKRGNLQVYKVDKDNNKVTLGNVEFDLYSHEQQKVIGTYYTDVNGEIYIEDLRVADYSLIEKKTNKWYNLSKDTELKIEWKKTTEVTVENELKKSQVKVIKVDQENHEVKLENVEFEVLDKDGNVLEKIKTNKEGEAMTSRYPVRDFESLYFKEVATNEKYVLDDTVHKVVLKENEIVNQTFENRKIKGQVKVVKTSEGDSKITGTKAGDPMPNVSFDIYDENKNYIETIKTGEDGTAITSLLEKGIYFVKESEKDSPEWYLLNTNEYSAEIVNDGDIITVEITNIPENPDVDIEKDGIIQTTTNQEIKYNFHIKNTGNTKLDNFVWTDVLPTDYITATRLITGTYNQDLNYSIYYKTNKNDYRLLKDNLNTKVNNYISFTDLQLEEDEFVTEFKADFGTVDVGFESVDTPQLFVNVKSTVKNDDVFTNKTRIEGYNKTYLVWDEDDHTTKVYEKKINVKLPRTGC